jgi:hypothetical protein
MDGVSNRAKYLDRIPEIQHLILINPGVFGRVACPACLLYYRKLVRKTFKKW